MGRAVDREIKALRALLRAVRPFNINARARMLDWFVKAAMDPKRCPVEAAPAGPSGTPPEGGTR